MKMKTKSIKIFELTVLVLLISIMSISAFGVGCAYSNENPLKLYPGESLDVLINLQNNEAIQLKASILEGVEIAEFLDANDVYSVPVNGWVNAKLKVSVPASASIGQEYAVTVSFSEVPGAQVGTVGFSTIIEKSFKVVVAEKPVVETPQGEGMSTTTIILLIIAIIVVIAIIWFLIKRKK